MIFANLTKWAKHFLQFGWWWLAIAIALTSVVYWPGLSGSWLFDDYPNIVDNKGVQPAHASLPSLINAALSSPSSEFKRPLASLSVAANYLATGLDPYWMKLTNLVIHLLNGLLIFLLARNLLWILREQQKHGATTKEDAKQVSVTGALIAAAWMLLPINLTAVLYVVQRMESMANLFVLVGLISYVAGRYRMLGIASFNATKSSTSSMPTRRDNWEGLSLCILGTTAFTAIGALAKETAVMLPLYAILIEWSLFHFKTRTNSLDHRVIILFTAVLALPMIAGLVWLIPQVLNPGYWSTRDFTLGTRLLSEARIVVAYIVWTLLPSPQALSFYHDDFQISVGLLTPWTTLASVLVLVSLLILAIKLRARHPLAALGIALFLSCHLLTATILPLELIYEHRNYFSSFGLMLAIVPLLTAYPLGSSPALLALPRRTLLAGLLLLWAGETMATAVAWGNPLLLAETLAARAPDSPRAQYELGRTYIIYSQYEPSSPFTHLAYAPLERSAALRDSSILPEQALIFLNSRMHLPLRDEWWNTMIAKLKSRRPTVQDESSLGALTQCARAGLCDLSKARMTEAFLAALSHPNPSARLLAMYSDYAWNVLNDRQLGLRMIEEAVATMPSEPAYHVTQIRMLIALDRTEDAMHGYQQLAQMNIGGSLDQELKELYNTIRAQNSSTAP